MLYFFLSNALVQNFYRLTVAFSAPVSAQVFENHPYSLENSFRRPTCVNLSAVRNRENRRRNIRKLRPRGGRAGVQRGSSLDRTIADNGIASDFCMPISRPALCRRQCTNNYAKRRPFIRPFGRIQTGLSVSIIVARRK